MEWSEGWGEPAEGFQKDWKHALAVAMQKYLKILSQLNEMRGGKAQTTNCKQLKSKQEMVIIDGKCWFLFLKKSA